MGQVHNCRNYPELSPGLGQDRFTLEAVVLYRCLFITLCQARAVLRQQKWAMPLQLLYEN